MKPRPLPYPNLILYNGKIRTFATDTSTCEALACSGSRIVATGKSDDIRRFAGPDTEIIDLQGRTAIPGLTDTHVHLSEKGTAEMELVDCRDFYVDVNSVSRYSTAPRQRRRQRTQGILDRLPWQPDAGLSHQRQSLSRQA